MQYDGDGSTLSEINGILVDADDPQGSVAAYITFDEDAVNTITKCAITWGNASEYGTYDITIYARDSSTGQSQGQITIYESFTVDFSEIPTRTTTDPGINSLTFTHASTISNSTYFGIINLDYYDPINTWSEFQITLQFDGESLTETYPVVLFPYGPNATRKLYYLEGFNAYGWTQTQFLFEFQAKIDGNWETIRSGDGNTFMDETSFIVDGSIDFYFSSSTPDPNEYALFFTTYFSGNYYDDFDYIEVEFISMDDETDVYSYTVDTTNLQNGIETELIQDQITGVTYKVRTIGYQGADETIICYEEIMLAQA